ncbi:MAG: RNA 2',3'-cyclic phosphodiesterase [Acidiferrobacterales bacterium]
MGEEENQRLFFALWPDEDTRERLATLALDDITGRRVSRDNLHVTLAFLGAVDKHARSCVEHVASQVRAPSFTLHMDDVGYWRKPRILWVRASRLPSPLVQLLSSLNDGLSTCGFKPERREYRAHVTLARKVHKSIAHRSIDSILWPINSFVLVESRTLPAGASYQVLRTWSLKDT